MESSSWLSLSDIAKLKVDKYWRKNYNLAKSKKMASFRGNQPHVTPHSLTECEWAAAYGWPATAAQKRLWKLATKRAANDNFRKSPSASSAGVVAR